MNNILQLTEKYDHAAHVRALLYKDVNIMDELVLIYDPEWKLSEEKCPYEVLTFLLDCYYNLPLRPDLASLFAWQAINRIYHDLAISLIAMDKKAPMDAEGINKLIEYIDKDERDFYAYLEPYFQKMPEKLFRFVAKYIIDGSLIDDLGAKKYLPHSYKTLSHQFPDLIENIKKSYVIAMKNRTNPRIENGRLVKKKDNETKEDRDASRKIVGNLAKKIKELIAKGETTFTLKENGQPVTIHFNNKQRLTFVMFGMLYASRCNNLHGNVESRMNSPYADMETFEAYTNVFLIEYMITAIGLVIMGKMDVELLEPLKRNASLLIE